MATEPIEIVTPDGRADARLTKPSGAARGAVLLLMDAYGLRPRIDEMAERIASHGYVVLAPNVFYRAGRAPVLPMPDMDSERGRAEFFTQVRPLMEALTPESLGRDGAAYIDALAERVPGPIALTGYCMGVRVALQIAAAYPDRVQALAGFHGGRLVSPGPDSPHLAVGRLNAEIFFGHADQDPSMSAEDIETLNRALRAAGLRHRAEVYAGARHGYTMADTPAYDAAACERHFTDLLGLLDRSFAASP